MSMWGTENGDSLYNDIQEFLDDKGNSVEDLLRIVGYAIDIHIRDNQNNEDSCAN